MEDFIDIAYLSKGSHKQKRVFNVLNHLEIFNLLKEYNPILTGTIPIGIDIESSDLDIICEVYNSEVFTCKVAKYFGSFPNFRISDAEKAIVINFLCDDLEIELYAQPMPTKTQNAYLHMVTENRILLQEGAEFKQKITSLKRSGHKTEPAFAMLLGLKGDPYQALLEYGKEKGFI